MRSPAWTWDELLLAGALVVENDWCELREGHRAVQELSEMLRSLTIHDAEVVRSVPQFRSPGSVSRKTTDLATNRPGFPGVPTRCGKLDHVVIAQFTERPTEMLAMAGALRKAYASGELEAAQPQPEETDDFGGAALEGRLLTRVLMARERSPSLRLAKIAEARRTGTPLSCAVCGFGFADFYGPVGEGYIEVHHVLPLHVSGVRQTTLSDLAFLCANCHRMCHRRFEGESWRTPEAVRVQLAGRTRAGD
ncbi:HNH endonuclease [Actinacidiphila bryophytorum]|uniref:HNH endonuclease n=1 Tax=Actinacidiphila bryophytorum TaxID=1436133 RepID=UPI0019601809|nr:HNH endonuclease [Actinacidiphila bryophytorum]MBM9434976.1 HNH endonuclease [Actinacidiphila bryophytorum]MBN6547486.1 HNH endonuclease [Actinacidiphila bryophytorum]